MRKQWISLVSVSLLAMVSAAHASPSTQHILIAPKCLLKNVNAPYHILANHHPFSLISANDTTVDVMSEAKSHRNKKTCGSFVDVTADWDDFKGETKSARDVRKFLAQHLHREMNKEHKDYTIKYREETTKLVNAIDADKMWADLKKLTSFPDRAGRSENGVKAAAWIKEQVESMAKASGHNDVTVYYVETGSYIQPSVVAKFGNSEEAGVVIGGHMDTLNSTYSNKPGADDDGSGTVTVMGVARTLLESGMSFKKPIYFIWYAAEEAGLVGSSYVVRDFKQKSIPVDSVIQFDMTGYKYQNDPKIFLMQDNVDRDLTNFLGDLIDTYVKTPRGKTRCGYGCSDHASWTDGGFRASMPFETAMGNDDPYIHTSEDKMDYIFLDHITDFAKLGVAFAVELAEPVN